MRYLLIFVYVTASPPVTVIGNYETLEACKVASQVINYNMGSQQKGIQQGPTMCVQAPKY